MNDALPLFLYQKEGDGEPGSLLIYWKRCLTKTNSYLILSFEAPTPGVRCPTEKINFCMCSDWTLPWHERSPLARKLKARIWKADIRDQPICNIMIKTKTNQTKTETSNLISPFTHITWAGRMLLRNGYGVTFQIDKVWFSLAEIKAELC